jgi:predicted nucleotidyltransferase
VRSIECAEAGTAVMTYGLSDETIQKICGLFSRYPQIDRAILYGSRAKGNYKNGSDIDLTLHGSALTLTLLYKIMTDIDDLLLPYMVDISIFHALSDPNFIDHIQRVGVVFYEKTREEIHV